MFAPIVAYGRVWLDIKWKRVDSNHRTPKGADLQSAAIATMRRFQFDDSEEQ